MIFGPYVDPYVVLVSDVAYFHPLLVLCLMLISSWIPGFLRGLFRLLSPLVYALAKLIRK